MRRVCKALVLLVWCAVVVAVATPAAAQVTSSFRAPKDLHLKPGRSVSFPFVLTDKGGFRWDIQSGGYIGQGTNYALSNGNYLQVSGSTFNCGSGRRSADGKEIELGPWSRNGVRVWRRVRVLPDYNVCRWLDIFENPSDVAKTLQVQLRTSMNYGLRQMHTSSGTGSFGSKDWAFITVHSYTGTRNIPQLLHVPCGPKSKLRPTVQKSSQAYVRWNLTIPPRKAFVLCHFQSQGSQDDLKKRMKEWQFRPLMKDLPWSVRKLIVNMRTFGFDREPLVIARTGLADRVELDNGDVLLGRVVNTQYKLTTFYGDFNIPAAKVTGLVAQGKGAARALVALSDGQVISGTLADPTLLFELPTGGTLRVPIDRVRQCGYQIGASKPEEVVMDSPLLVLRTGDRLAFEDQGLKLMMHSAHGPVNLPAGSLRGVQMDLPEGGIHQVTFRNGSKLSGILGPAVLAVKLQLGPQMTVQRQKVRRMVWPGDANESDGVTTVTLLNEDELFGRVDLKQLALHNEFSATPLQIDPTNVVSMTFDARRPGIAALRLWDGTVLRGRLAREELPFSIAVDGPRMTLDVARVVAIVSPMAMPPKELQKHIEELIGKLGSEILEDRQKAAADLVRIGTPAKPLLNERLNDPDPEIRQRVRDVMEELESGTVEPPPVRPQPMMWGRQGVVFNPPMIQSRD